MRRPPQFSQALGDYVLAHGYVREDHVLDADLPTWVPIPPLAEVQVALEQAVEEVTGLSGFELKRIMRTGTVATIDNRNWELRDHREPVQRFSQSRAIALDMESATIAANGFRFRVPYGTLLCVSDKPLHGELKLPGMASDFYRRQVSQHLEIGIRADGEAPRDGRRSGSIRANCGALPRRRSSNRHLSESVRYFGRCPACGLDFLPRLANVAGSAEGPASRKKTPSLSGVEDRPRWQNRLRHRPGLLRAGQAGACGSVGGWTLWAVDCKARRPTRSVPPAPTEACQGGNGGPTKTLVALGRRRLTRPWSRWRREYAAGS